MKQTDVWKKNFKGQTWQNICECHFFLKKICPSRAAKLVLHQYIRVLAKFFKILLFLNKCFIISILIKKIHVKYELSNINSYYILITEEITMIPLLQLQFNLVVPKVLRQFSLLICWTSNMVFKQNLVISSWGKLNYDFLTVSSLQFLKFRKPTASGNLLDWWRNLIFFSNL